MANAGTDAQSIKPGMGTVITHKIFGGRSPEALQAAERETVRLERMLSRFIPDSEISRINGSAGIRQEKVSHETYEVLSRAAELSRRCGGCFDVTVGPLVDLWRSSGKENRPPDASAIKQVLPLIDYTGMIFDSNEGAVCLKRPGQSIDLGGIGKGYAADKILEVFKEYEVTSAFTNFGGNVAVTGAKPDGTPWRIGIQHPRAENSLIGAVWVSDRSVVTSGDYQRYFIDGRGKRYHHILDPETGYPAESGVISATVVADSSMDADALSTILFVAGMGMGLKVLRTFPGAEAILVDEELGVYVTRGLKGSFQAVAGVAVKILQY